LEIIWVSVRLRVKMYDGRGKLGTEEFWTSRKPFLYVSRQENRLAQGKGVKLEVMNFECHLA
jgi:hypothetical protein